MRSWRHRDLCAADSPGQCSSDTIVTPHEPTPVRTPTPVDQLAENYLIACCELDPVDATRIGVRGFDDQVTDYSPDGIADRVRTARAARRRLEAAAPTDDIDTVTIAAMVERIDSFLALADADLLVGELNVISSPLQSLRRVFDLQPTETSDDWRTLVSRLSHVPRSLDSYTEGLRARQRTAHPHPVRQVECGIDHARMSAAAFDILVRRGPHDDSALGRDLTRAAHAASRSYLALAEILESEFAPHAGTTDSVGREVYRLKSRSFLGTSIDLEETYDWGRATLDSIVAEQQRTADALVPGAGVRRVLELLDANPRYTLRGTDALQRWMQDLSDRTLAELKDSHFTIPREIERLECRIAPTRTGGIYYTGPDEDLTRPGRMWWSVPSGVDRFHTWHETSRVFHEGVPGHHLQVGTAMARRYELNRWRRLANFTPGHGEGWALYAETLAVDLSLLGDPADLLGMLQSQRLRAARVVIDIGLHCALPAPSSLGGGIWDPGKAWVFLAEHCVLDEISRRHEHDRYLGWAGQAPSYAVGQRLWQQLRDDYFRRNPEADLRQFHDRTLAVGSVGMDVLRRAALGSGPEGTAQSVSSPSCGSSN
ncbi:MAG: DUF885 domain-containing protein [Pseudonocardia sp.]|nr:MAG: DUF885 domain-containing protein [Pseudonocardia sp.]